MAAISVLCMIGIACTAVSVMAAGAPEPTRVERTIARRWVAESFRQARRDFSETALAGGQRANSSPPFSFLFGGRHSDRLLRDWQYRQSTERLDADRTRWTQTYRDPESGLEVRCVRVEYRTFPVVEWTLFFKNTGTSDTPVLEEILPLDTRVSREAEGEFVLHHNMGTPCTPEDFRPLETTLERRMVKRIGAAGGRPLNTDMPYFNLEWNGQGRIIALGWPGQWTSSFLRDEGRNLRMVAGQEGTHFVLHPGEEVRAPLVVMLFWKGGDVVRSQNIWRRWMVRHNLPRQNGKLLDPVFSGAAADLFPNLINTMADERAFIEGYEREGLKIDYWWRDAGWYPCGDSWVNTGTWEPDPARYPRGLRELADQVHAVPMKLTVWFEPERVAPGTWLAQNHPEWVLGGAAGGLLDLGNAEARNWVIEHLDRFITGQGIDMYRQDFNMDPLPYWRSHDTEDRRGITEIRHIEGLLAFWDELRRRHPAMPFDCCASGGRRDELEMMRRGVPLSKTDYAGGTTSSQCQLYGIASWLPYFGAGAAASEDIYLLRSNMAPWTAVCWDTRSPKLNYPLLRRYMSEWRKVSGLYLDDFYPLTPYSLDESVWMAWQFDSPEKGEGVVQAFRRPQSAEETATYRLRGLVPSARYDLVDFDTGSLGRRTGRDLMEQGLTVTLREKPQAAVIVYTKVSSSSRSGRSPR